jgi:hypothetical protein
MATPAAAQIEHRSCVRSRGIRRDLACNVIACVVAALIPALRAARIDPVRTLTQD